MAEPAGIKGICPWAQKRADYSHYDHIDVERIAVEQIIGRGGEPRKRKADEAQNSKAAKDAGEQTNHQCEAGGERQQTNGPNSHSHILKFRYICSALNHESEADCHAQEQQHCPRPTAWKPGIQPLQTSSGTGKLPIHKKG
jgi:hypothetical protein